MARTSLPHDLDQRLQVVWQRLGHLIDWCDNSAEWTQFFCSEDRPYRETFYWEAVARMDGFDLNHAPRARIVFTGLGNFFPATPQPTELGGSK